VEAEGIDTMKFKLVLAFAVLTAVVPAFAESGPHAISAHVREQHIHDRSPRVHSRGSQPHHEA
jgi:hypothetical protein